MNINRSHTRHIMLFGGIALFYGLAAPGYGTVRLIHQPEVSGIEAGPGISVRCTALVQINPAVNEEGEMLGSFLWDINSNVDYAPQPPFQTSPLPVRPAYITFYGDNPGKASISLTIPYKTQGGGFTTESDSSSIEFFKAGGGAARRILVTRQ